MKIYDINGVLIIDVAVDDNSYRTRTIMGDHSLTLYFSLPDHMELPIGAYCEYEGQRYSLMLPEQFKMKHKRYFEYTVTFSSEHDKSKIWKFRNPVDGRLKFPLTAKPKEHLQMFVDNMNQRDSGWEVGACIDEVEKLITYDHDYCWDALSKMASEFETEFEIEGKMVSLRKVEYNKSNPLHLSYGRGNGFKSGVGRSNSGDTPPVEVLYVQGGDRNIDRSIYPEDKKLRASSNGCLILPVGQTIGYDGEHFEDEQEYNPENARHYKVDELGLSIRNIDKELTSHAEDSLDRADDYPKPIGKVTEAYCVDEENNFYDFVDEDIPEELNYEDCLINGESMTVIFQSGMLAGREFEVKYHHKPKIVNGEEKPGRRFEIVPQEEDGMTMPNDTFRPEPDNEFAIFHVMLPEAYIRNDRTKSGASWDMFRAAVRYFYDNEERKYTFTGELDGLWTKKNWLNIGAKIRLGGYVSFTDESFQKEPVLVRIITIKDYINKPHSPKIELSNETVSGSVSATLKKLESAEVAVDDKVASAVQYAKRRFRDAKQTIDMLDKAMLDNFSATVNPIAVQTMSMLVGDESLQFVFTKDIESEIVVSDTVNYDNESKRLSVSESFIKHLTYGITSIKQNHSSEEFRRWTMEPFESAVLSDSAKSYYLYAKVEKDGKSGCFLMSETSISMNPKDGSLYFLVGILNSEYNGTRSFAPLYGFSEVLPGRITTDLIVSNDGNTYFNLRDGIIGGRMKFESGSSGLGNIEEFSKLNSSVLQGDAANRTAIARLNDTIIDGGYIRTSLINAAELVAQKVLAGDRDGQHIDLDPDSKSIRVVSKDGTTTIFEGNQYPDPRSLFGNSSGIIRFSNPEGSYQTTGEGSVSVQNEAISIPFHTETPVEIKLDTDVLCSAHCDRNPIVKPDPDGDVITEEKQHFTNVNLQISLATYSDEQCTEIKARTIVANLTASADGSVDYEGNYPNIYKTTSISLNDKKIVTATGGHHRFEVSVSVNSTSGKGSAAWGSTTPLNAEYTAAYYVSRYFNNGYLLGTSAKNYILAYRNQKKGMCLILENNGYGLRFTDEGIQKKSNDGDWENI